MTWLFVAFSIVWVAIFFYAFNMDRKQRALSEELNDIKTRMGS
jgi:CcmD family protein